MDSNSLLKMEHVTKRFPGVVALDDMTLDVKQGTVHALMGENGAGKSTLMKILVGLYKADEGQITFDGKPLNNASIHSVLQQGISMIYQELNPIETLSAAENIYCGKIPNSAGGFKIHRRQMNRNAQKWLDKLHITSIKPTTKVRTLSMAQKQLLEIAKALANDSKLIIMDEPTSAITEAECQNLFETIRELKEEGITFIYISHKLDEIFQICDEVTVMRDGKYVGTRDVAKTNSDELVTMMVGREITNIYPKEEVEIGEEVMRVEGLSGEKFFHNVSFDVRRGEILGFAGLMGAGRTETMEAIFGVRKKTAGDIFIDGKKVEIRSSRAAIKNKMAFLTEDRRNTGCMLRTNVFNNIMVLSWRNYTNAIGKIRQRKCREVAKEQIVKFGVKTTGLKQLAGELSGGNQQKMLLARWRLPNPRIIILDEPTRGIDVGSKYEIYKEMMRLVKQGCSIIMISSELPEILGMSDRIVVMHEGEVSGILDAKEANQELVLRYAAGLV